MNLRLLTVHHLEFLSLKGGCADWSESTITAVTEPLLVALTTLMEILRHVSIIKSHHVFLSKPANMQTLMRCAM